MISLWTRFSERDSSGLRETAMRKSNSRAGAGKSRCGEGKWSRERWESSCTFLDARDGLCKRSYWSAGCMYNEAHSNETEVAKNHVKIYPTYPMVLCSPSTSSLRPGYGGSCPPEPPAWKRQGTELGSHPQLKASSLVRLVPSWPELVTGVAASVGAAVVGSEELSVSVAMLAMVLVTVVCRRRLGMLVVVGGGGWYKRTTAQRRREGKR